MSFGVISCLVHRRRKLHEEESFIIHVACGKKWGVAQLSRPVYLLTNTSPTLSACSSSFSSLRCRSTSLRWSLGIMSTLCRIRTVILFLLSRPVYLLTNTSPTLSAYSSSFSSLRCCSTSLRWSLGIMSTLCRISFMSCLRLS